MVIMINFFRHLRKQKITDGAQGDGLGKTSSYIKYAIGEIMLVVVGILIALQINTWNETRKNKRQERETLELLKGEYEENIHQLNTKVNLRVGMINSAFKLLSLIDNNSFQMYPTDSVEIYIVKTIIFPTFNPSIGVTNDIINSGKLYIISNSELRIFLSAWTSDISQVSEIEQVWLNYAQNHYIPFLIDNYEYRNGMNSLWNDYKTTQNMKLRKSQLEELTIGRSRREVDLVHIFSNVNFEDHLSNLIAYNYLANAQSSAIQLKLEEVLEIINKELENK